MQGFEIIIVDDNSSDNTKEVAMSFSDQRITFIKNKKHLGLGLSRNVGVRNAKGKYIVFLDCNDECLPERLKNQYNFLENNLDYDVCGSRAIRIIDDVEKGKTWNHPLDKDLIGPTLLFAAFCLSSTMMLRKTLFTEKNLWYSDIKTSEDHEYQARLYSDNIKMINIEPSLVKHYMSPRARSYKITSQKELDSINIISKLLDLKAVASFNLTSSIPLP